jgi:hypothetical protein
MAEQTDTNVQYIKDSIDAYLGASVMGKSFTDVVEIYVDNKLGFKTTLQEYLDKNKDLTKEEIQQVKDIIKAEKEEAIKNFKEGASKDELKKKFDEFKSTAFEVGRALKSVPTEFIKVVSESVMPNVIGPVGPNPFSIVLKAYNGIVKLKRAIDRIFISLQMFITAAEALGIDKTQEFNAFVSPIANGLRTLQSTINNIKNKEEENASNIELQAKIEEAKKNWNYTFAGRDWDAESVEELARGNLFKMYQFPLTEDNRKDLFKAENKLDSNDAAKRQKAKWAHVIRKYDDWTRWFTKQLNTQKDSGAAATTSSGNGSSDAVYSGSTRN